MTNEEAILNIDMALSEVEWQYPMDYAVAFKMAIEAIEKQIPKKPIVAEMEWVSQPVECKCPTCGEYVCKYDTWARATLKEHHCKCGQAIDWSGDND